MQSVIEALKTDWKWLLKLGAAVGFVSFVAQAYLLPWAINLYEGAFQ